MTRIHHCSIIKCPLCSSCKYIGFLWSQQCCITNNRSLTGVHASHMLLRGAQPSPSQPGLLLAGGWLQPAGRGRPWLGWLDSTLCGLSSRCRLAWACSPRPGRVARGQAERERFRVPSAEAGYKAKPGFTL